MLGLAQPDRWTCPTCLLTEVSNAGKAGLHFAIVCAQKRHALIHAAERAGAR